MARVFTSGGETGSLYSETKGQVNVVNGVVLSETGQPVRSGQYAYKFTHHLGNVDYKFEGSNFNQTFFTRAYTYFASMSTGDWRSILSIEDHTSGSPVTGDAVPMVSLDISSDLGIRLYNRITNTTIWSATGVGAASFYLPNNVWNKIDIGIRSLPGVKGGGYLDDYIGLRINNVLIYETMYNFGTSHHPGKFRWGWHNNAFTGAPIFYVDDIGINNSDTEEDNTYLLDGHIIYMTPATTLDTDQWNATPGYTHEVAVSDRPPTSPPRITSASSLSANLITFRTAPYEDVGIAALDAIKYMFPVIVHAQTLANNSAATGSIEITSNPPTLTPHYFIYGGTENTPPPSAFGTYPTGWSITWGPGVSNPVVTRSVRANLVIGDISSTVTSVLVSQCGIMVEYRSPTAQIPKSVLTSAAIKILSKDKLVSSTTNIILREKAYPITDELNDGWTGTSTVDSPPYLWARLNPVYYPEAASISTGQNPDPNTYRASLSPVADPLSKRNHKIIIQFIKIFSGDAALTSQLNLRVIFYQRKFVLVAGNWETQYTNIRDTTWTNIPEELTTWEISLSTTEADMITNYNMLSLTLNATTGIERENGGRIRVADAYLQTPGAPTAKPPRSFSTTAKISVAGRFTQVLTSAAIVTQSTQEAPTEATIRTTRAVSNETTAHLGIRNIGLILANQSASVQSSRQNSVISSTAIRIIKTPRVPTSYAVKILAIQKTVISDAAISVVDKKVQITTQIASLVIPSFEHIVPGFAHIVTRKLTVVASSAAIRITRSKTVSSTANILSGHFGTVLVSSTVATFDRQKAASSSARVTVLNTSDIPTSTIVSTLVVQAVETSAYITWTTGVYVATSAALAVLVPGEWSASETFRVLGYIEHFVPAKSVIQTFQQRNVSSQAVIITGHVGLVSSTVHVRIFDLTHIVSSSAVVVSLNRVRVVSSATVISSVREKTALTSAHIQSLNQALTLSTSSSVYTVLIRFVSTSVSINVNNIARSVTQRTVITTVREKNVLCSSAIASVRRTLTVSTSTATRINDRILTTPSSAALLIIKLRSVANVRAYIVAPGIVQELSTSATIVKRVVAPVLTYINVSVYDITRAVGASLAVEVFEATSEVPTDVVIYAPLTYETHVETTVDIILQVIATVSTSVHILLAQALNALTSGAISVSNISRSVGVSSYIYAFGEQTTPVLTSASIRVNQIVRSLTTSTALLVVKRKSFASSSSVNVIDRTKIVGTSARISSLGTNQETFVTSAAIRVTQRITVSSSAVLRVSSIRLLSMTSVINSQLTRAITTRSAIKVGKIRSLPTDTYITSVRQKMVLSEAAIRILYSASIDTTASIEALDIDRVISTAGVIKSVLTRVLTASASIVRVKRPTVLTSAALYIINTRLVSTSTIVSTRVERTVSTTAIIRIYWPYAGNFAGEMTLEPFFSGTVIIERNIEGILHVEPVFNGTLFIEIDSPQE